MSTRQTSDILHKGSASHQRLDLYLNSLTVGTGNVTFTTTDRILGRDTSGAGAGEELTLSQILDFIGSPAQGDILYRGASTWARLPAGSSGEFLKTLGAGANPLWATVPAAFSMPAGSMMEYAGETAPSLWLLCYGQAVSRTTYAALMVAIRRSATITVTIASPAVVSWTAHGLSAGDPVVFRTTGALPTGITAGTVYFVISAGLTADAFEIGATAGGAAINTSGSQSGVQTGVYAPWGDGDGSTTFNIPDRRGRVGVGQDDMGGTSANRLTGVTGSVDGDVLGGTGGAEIHTLTTAEMPAHTHSTPVSEGIDNSQVGTSDRAVNTDGVTGSAGGGGAHNNVQPSIVTNFIIYAGV